MIATAVLAATLAAGPTWAPPVDHRPCVSAREFHGYHVAEVRRDLEARWEVAGRGRVETVPDYGRAVIYPRCGYSRRQAWYGVHYTKDRHGRLWGDGLIWWHRQHPAPAPAPAEPEAPPPGPPQLVQLRG